METDFFQVMIPKMCAISRTLSKGFEIVGPAVLHGYKLVERKYADIVESKEDAVHGVLYGISEQNLANLDRREGVWIGSYRRMTVPVVFNGETVYAQTYEMTEENRLEQEGESYSDKYRERCSDGARYHGIPNAFETVKIVVYGTLMTGECNHGYCRNACKIRECSIFGTLYDTGYGYPAFSLNGSTRIQAELIEIPGEDFPAVDDLEGYPNLYTRQMISVTLPDGSKEEGWVYLMNKLPKNAEIISCGNWKEYRMKQ